MARDTSTSMLPQPFPLAVEKPKSTPPKPKVESTTDSTSICGWVGSPTLCTVKQAAAITPPAIATSSANIQRQLSHSTSRPEMVGPSAGAKAMTMSIAYRNS